MLSSIRKYVKNYLEWILIGLVFLGAIIIACDTIGNIIYGIYLWGGKGMEFSAALWEATKSWLSFLGVGILSMIIGYAGVYYSERRR